MEYQVYFLSSHTQKNKKFMKKIYLGLFLTILILTASFSASAQNYWQSAETSRGNVIKDKAVARESFPIEYKLFSLNISPLRQALISAVNSSASSVISLPNAEGNLEQFQIFEASNFEPALQAQFPQIRAFSGKGITDKSATLKLSISPQGIQTMVFRSEKANEFSEPYSEDHTVYAVYRSQRNKGQLPWTCSTQDQQIFASINSRIVNSNFPESNDGTLKTMRLAQSCNGEYANYFGAFSSAQVGLVLAAYNATLTRCNGTYEKDLALHLNLIANTTDVIFYDPITDPYTTLGAWNGQLQATLNSVIGAANYDIGHMFGASGGGGNAGCIGCVCGTLKGSGITSPADGIPQGDNFDIDYVAHEVGHQLGANHTFSMSIEGGGVNNKEVGSGITIMGYAGITGQDVAPHSIDVWHQNSIQQIQNNLATKTCPITTSLAGTNATPVVAAVSNYTIPITTPFALTGSATDANAGDVLTYCWEQNDQGTSATTGGNSVASPTKLIGPNWLTFPAVTSPVRTFPRLATILNGAFVTGPLPGGDPGANIEALSSVARVLNFRLTVRDNVLYSSTAPIKVGQTNFTDMIVTVDATSGPFAVTSPNTNVSYAGGSTQTITWSVNNTTLPPVSCANVKISYSTDGGLTFPTVLAASTANDGSESLTIPTGATTTARIKIEAEGNIFFDISNSNFTVSVPLNSFAFTPTTPTTVACPATAPTVTIGTSVSGVFITPIVLTATAGVPAGTTVTFAPNPLTPGSSTVATLNNANVLIAGTYNITVTGTAGSTVQTTTITYIISSGAGPAITTQPSSQTVCAPNTATFSVVSPALGVTYQWQVSTAIVPAFTNISGALGATYMTLATNAAMNGNVYRVIVSSQCGSTTSANATLTVNTAAAFTTQPSNQSACTGNTATFTVAASGTGVTYLWQSAPTAGGPFTNVTTGTGGTTASYTTAPVTVTTNGFYQVIITTTACAGTVTSNVVQLTISATTAINTQPTNQTVCAPTAATYTVSATGTGLSYQWQFATAAAPTVFTNVGTNSSGYNTGATSVGMNGNIYRVIVTGSCNAITSANVTLTVNTSAAIIAPQPADVTVCNGTPASFTVSATGTGVTYQWQSAPTAGGPFTNVPIVTGGTTATYTIAATTPAMNNTYYQVVVSTTACPGSATTVPAKLTVNTIATTTSQPIAQSACVPNTATFNVTAIGTGLTYQWQFSTNGGTTFTDILGAQAASYTTPATIFSMNGNLYRVNILSTCSPTTPTTSNAVVLTVNNPVTITQNPQAQSGCAGDNYTFSVSATGGSLAYQWQVSTNGGTTYTNVVPAVPAAPSTSGTQASYTINNAPLSLNGNLYRVIVTGTPCGQVITPGALFTLTNRPTIVLTAASASSLNPSVNSGLYTTVSPATGSFIYTWKKNGVILPNLIATTFIPLSIDDFGSYQVTITDAVSGCTALSNIVKIDSLVSNRLFIYPNPVKTSMQVRYYSSTTAPRGTMINVFDSRGARVFSRAYTISGTYGRMDVDMTKMQQGVYMVELNDASGKKLASGRVIKHQ